MCSEVSTLGRCKQAPLCQLTAAGKLLWHAVPRSRVGHIGLSRAMITTLHQPPHAPHEIM